MITLQDIRANLQVSLFVMLTSIFSIIYGGNLNLSTQLATSSFILDEPESPFLETEQLSFKLMMPDKTK